jgi:hypothetical protein
VFALDSKNTPMLRPATDVEADFFLILINAPVAYADGLD